ncbi:MAG: hypothetical protein PHP69_04475 [Candidatus Omnitrophica bacterium]|nr:hypothetical protein [Candidatus Omnitrophota bacterium]MDD5441571.1 hypothetical protein [Candidatus Omnitrophota bacterium]
MENRELNKKLLNKQKWLKLEMTRVKLSPEQAVLSCCDFGIRAGVTPALLTKQCNAGLCLGSVTFSVSS